MDQPAEPFDLMRMIFGQEGILFYAEIFIRTGIIYFYTLLLLRWVGARSVSQLSIVEFLLVIALGSAVGDALFYPEVPLLHALAAITLVVLFNRLIDEAMAHWGLMRRVFEGSSVILASQGRLDMAMLKRQKLSRNDVFEQMRSAGVSNLGQVAAAYLESNGTVSVFRLEDAKPGLSILPGAHADLCRPHEMAQACATCGHVENERGKCVHCGAIEWHPASLQPKGWAA